MPSDKKRQRQQRVRHEAGPAESRPDGPNSNSITGDVSSSLPVDDGKTINHKDSGLLNEKKSTNKNQAVVREKIPDTRIRIGGSKNQKSFSNQQSKESNKKNATVAYADEKQYEPVSIMGGVQEIPKDKIPPQYQRRAVISNWLKYDEVPAECDIEDGEDYMLGEDYSEVLRLHGENSNREGYLHLKNELSWGEDHSKHLENHGLGALKILDLCAALSTIPFNEQLKIDDKMLPMSDIHAWSNIALDNKKTYVPNKEYATNIEANEKILESLRFTDSDSIILLKEEPVIVKPCVDDGMKKFTEDFSEKYRDVDVDKFFSIGKESNIQSRISSTSPRSISPDTDNIATNSSLTISNSSQSKVKKFNFGLPNSDPNTNSQSEVKNFNFDLPTNDQNTNSSQSEVKNFNFGLPTDDQNTNSSRSEVKNFNSDLPTIDQNTNSSQSEMKDIGLPTLDQKTNSSQSAAIDIDLPTNDQNMKVSSTIVSDLTSSSSPPVNNSSEEVLIKESCISLDEPLTPLPLSPDPIAATTKTETEELEEWLDSILDD